MSLIDWSTQAGARELARRITAYWLGRGCTPTIRIEPMLVAPSNYAINDRDRIYVVRSDMGGELPKQSIKSTAA